MPVLQLDLQTQPNLETMVSKTTTSSNYFLKILSQIKFVPLMWSVSVCLETIISSDHCPSKNNHE